MLVVLGSHERPAPVVKLAARQMFETGLRADVVGSLNQRLLTALDFPKPAIPDTAQSRAHPLGFRHRP